MSSKTKTGDAKYFETTKKGEIHELRSDLNSFDQTKIKDAVKKVIAAMTVGKDVSDLFPDVIKSMGTEDIELKKLVYLYIINYARSQPAKAILVVNTFQKDARDHPNPLVRALAIRTMGCIRVDRITEYLCDPLASALKDKDPYVRKTAAVCVAKLYDINSELVEERGFVDTLRGLISDPNPMVVANAVAALTEISELSGTDKFGINSSTKSKLLTALNECTEWGQVFIIDALAKYDASPKDAESIAERVAPRLQHANSAVVMSAIKVIVNYLDVIEDKALVNTLVKKLAPPLVTLLSAPPEIQYVALRNIFLIVQKRPDILQHEVRVFFCKYNDAPYVKVEKLEIMIKLASEKNIEQVLNEFKEYAQEIDIEFVRKAVSAVGRVAIKLEATAERCVDVLLDLIKMKVNYVVQEAVIVIKDVFRRYPNRFERVIVDLCESLESLDEPEAKASMIWIVGEYAERIEDAPERLEYFLDTFQEESATVQLQLLTAIVKLFLKRPEGTQDLVKRVLDMATENSDNPDLRDRGYVYWRLLSTDPAVAKSVVLAEKPVISGDTHVMEKPFLNTMISHISTLASVYHKTPESFVKSAIGDLKFKRDGFAENKGDDSDDSYSGSDSEESGSEGSEEGSEEGSGSESEEDIAASAKQDDFLGIGFDDGDASSSSSAAPSNEPPKTLYSASSPEQFEVGVKYDRRNGQAYFDFHLTNHGSAPITKVALRFNDNFLGLKPARSFPELMSGPIRPGGSTVVQLPISSLEDNPDKIKKTDSTNVQMAMKIGPKLVVYFQDEVPAEIFFEESGELEKPKFLEQWKKTPSDMEVTQVMHGVRGSDSTEILRALNVFSIATRKVAKVGLVCYFSTSLRGTPILLELTFGDSSAKGCAKSTDKNLSQIALNAVQNKLSA